MHQPMAHLYRVQNFLFLKTNKLRILLKINLKIPSSLDTLKPNTQLFFLEFFKIFLKILDHTGHQNQFENPFKILLKAICNPLNMLLHDQNFYN